MKQNCNKNLLKVLELAENMNALVKNGLIDSNDDSCIILYGIVRDSAYKIKTIAETEIEQHKTLNKWD
ncbi:MAG: hypothetical protein GY756_01695 [bacterium]|nr:hypothetical protein [bacterium]